MVGKGTWLGRLKRSYILLALCKEFRMMNHTARMYMSQFKGCTFPPKDIIMKKKRAHTSPTKKVGKSTPRLHYPIQLFSLEIGWKRQSWRAVCVRGYICILVYTKIINICVLRLTNHVFPFLSLLSSNFSQTRRMEWMIHTVSIGTPW